MRPNLKRTLFTCIALSAVILLLALTRFSNATQAKPASDNHTKIVVNTFDPSPINLDRLLGTNVPAWLNPDRLNNETLHQQTIASGSKLMRAPGGSWSNEYDWLACERGWGIDQSAKCLWPWAATVSDFIQFAQATDQEIIYTVNMNGTAKEAAALVAFFNGDPNDNRVIGWDVRGRDWGTVGQWAQMRVDKGFTNSTRVNLFEFGNEVYGGKPAVSPACTRWGWEEVWTCSPNEYINGVGSGKERHEGFKEFKKWMTFVDETIQLGGVGVPFQHHWLDWGNLVIQNGGQEMDFYIIHEFPYFLPPDDYNDILSLPQEKWDDIGKDIRNAFQDHANIADIPIAVTEYNLFADQSKDPKRWMTRAVNGLYVADTIGQMAKNGVDIANYWSLASENHQNGTTFGLTDDTTFRRTPQYYVFPLWTQFGEHILPVESTLPADTRLSVYAGQVDADTFSVIAINKTDEPITADISLLGTSRILRGTKSVMRASHLDSQRVFYNGVVDPDYDLSNAPPQKFYRPSSFEFAPYSVTLLHLETNILSHKFVK